MLVSTSTGEKIIFTTLNRNADGINPGELGESLVDSFALGRVQKWPRVLVLSGEPRTGLLRGSIFESSIGIRHLNSVQNFPEVFAASGWRRLDLIA